MINKKLIALSIKLHKLFDTYYIILKTVIVRYNYSSATTEERKLIEK